MNKNLKNLKLDRNQLRMINGGFQICPPDYECGNNRCCINGACRPISVAGPNGYCMAPPV